MSGNSPSTSRLGPSSNASTARRSHFAVEYEVLDRECEGLTSEERALGCFTELTP